MSAIPLYPLTCTPILRRLIWGGRRLGTVLNKPIGPGGDYAESWELADHRDTVSVVDRGSLAGTSLRELLATRGRELLGPGIGEQVQFPLLVKLLDAREVLSVQVHPDDELGRRLANDNGKTETWVVIAAEPGSVIYAGLKEGVTAEMLRAAVETNDVEPLLHSFEARPGQCVMIEAGTVHAIGAGVLLAEIQQMSDATFRVYDWGRVGPDGKARELHISQALESTNFGRGPVDPLTTHAEPMDDGHNTREALSRCPYFVLERLRLSAPTEVGSAERFTILLGLGGSAEVLHPSAPAPVGIGLGRTVLLPAALGACRIVPDGRATILTCQVP